MEVSATRDSESLGDFRYYEIANLCHSFRLHYCSNAAMAGDSI
jgi:hypothetical protein